VTRNWWRLIRFVALGIVALIAGYAAAGLIGGAIPSNAGWRAPDDGIRIAVSSNGVHTGLIVPVVAAGVDWRGLLRPEHLRDPRYAGYPAVEIGWGERGFYLETPTWADVRPATVIAAAIGSDRTVMHVDHLPFPAPDAHNRVITLRPEEYRRLAQFIRASFGPHDWHRAGYFTADAFYDGRGHYSAIRTCNTWTGDALRYAGVRVGAWTPFAASVMQWFRM
jgi:uncharacterized protein (TIGR02117 family)